MDEMKVIELEDLGITYTFPTFIKRSCYVKMDSDFIFVRTNSLSLSLSNQVSLCLIVCSLAFLLRSGMDIFIVFDFDNLDATLGMVVYIVFWSILELIPSLCVVFLVLTPPRREVAQQK